MMVKRIDKLHYPFNSLVPGRGGQRPTADIEQQWGIGRRHASSSGWARQVELAFNGSANSTY